MNRQAFTLIEMILVIVILAVLAGAVAPRLMGSSSRDAEASARTIAKLISVAAHRDSLDSAAVAIRYDPRARVIVLETPSADAPRGWKTDPMLDAAPLGPLELRSAALDGSPLDVSGWTYLFPRHEPRGVLELQLTHADSDRAAERWTITLPPGVSSATLRRDSASPALAPIDLDASGKGDEPW